MPKFLSLNFFLILFVYGMAQDRIDADRPDQTESAELTPAHYVQAEFGFGMEKSGGRNYDISHPDMLLKYGVTKRFELRLENAYITAHTQTLSQSGNNSGFEPLRIGFRTAICEEGAFIPKTSLLAHVGIPFLGSKDYKTQHLAPSFLLAMKNTLTDKFGISYNLGAEWDGFTSDPAWLYSLSAGSDLGKKCDVFFEIFGSVVQNEMAANSIDTGLGYYISNNVRLDASGGIGISGAAADYFFGAGLSFRFH